MIELVNIAIKKFNSENKIKNVVFPGMGTGVGKFPYDLAAKQMKYAYDEIVLNKIPFPSDFAEAQKRNRALIHKSLI